MPMLMMTVLSTTLSLPPTMKPCVLQLWMNNPLSVLFSDTKPVV